MRRTGFTDLAIPLVVIGVAVYALLQATYGDLPPLQFLVPVPIAALAVVEFVVARRVRALVRHDPRAKPMTAISIARCVALGKASALVGAGVVGAGVALLIKVAPDAGAVDAASHDLRVGALVIVAGALLAAAGVLLERAGIDPRSGDDDRGHDGPPGPGKRSGRTPRS